MNQQHRTVVSPARAPKMFAALQYVQANPGCQAIEAARHVGPHGSLRFGYAAVKRAIRAGLIVAVRRPEHRGRYALRPA